MLCYYFIIPYVYSNSLDNPNPKAPHIPTKPKSVIPTSDNTSKIGTIKDPRELKLTHNPMDIALAPGSNTYIE